ncbi:MAG: dephospho-CoA kinase [Pseudomonadota bacterium]
MIKAALTGSIGMGKSTTAAMFADAGIPVYDADAAVHSLYEGEAVPLVEAAFPGSSMNGRIDREKLGRMVLGNPQALKKLEAIVHPLVHARQKAFIDQAETEGQRLVILDIPLLFETGGEGRVDKIIVVSAPAEEQKRRVLARPGMTEEKFEAILARQVPDAEKRKRADFVIDTGKGLDHAREQVLEIIKALG